MKHTTDMEKRELGAYNMYIVFTRFTQPVRRDCFEVVMDKDSLRYICLFLIYTARTVQHGLDSCL